jgi:hypothetical protein
MEAATEGSGSQLVHLLHSRAVGQDGILRPINNRPVMPERLRHNTS